MAATSDWISPDRPPQPRPTAASLAADDGLAATQDRALNGASWSRVTGNNNAQNQRATALGYKAQGDAGMQASTQLGNEQRARGILMNEEAKSAGGEYRGAAAGAQNRNTMLNMGAGSVDAQRANAARTQAFQALGGSMQQGQANADALRGFYQQGPGPSAAQAQLQGASEQNMANSLALARSGRNGMSPAAERQAMFQNAATGAQTNQQLAVLRAQEEATARGQNLQAITSARGLDIQDMSAQQQAIAAQRAQDLQAQGLSFEQARAQAATELQSRGLNDQTSLGYEGLSAAERARGQAAALGYEGLANQSVAQGQGFNVAMTGQANTAMGQGLSAQQAGDTNALGYTGIDARMSETGANNQLERQKLAESKRASEAANEDSVLDWFRELSDEREKYDKQRTSTASALGYMQGKNPAAGGYAPGSEDDSDYRRKPEETDDDSGDGSGKGMFGKFGKYAALLSDKKTKELEGELARLGNAYKALGGDPATVGVRRGGDVGPQDEDARDPYGLAGGGAPRTAKQGYSYPPGGDAYRARQAAALGYESPNVDLRPAQGYSYRYKDPSQPGAAPGRQVGPMAQDLEKSPATRGAVSTGPDGVKRVDPGRLTMVNTAAISEQQRRIDKQQAELDEIGRQQLAQYKALGGPPSRGNRSAGTGGL